MALLIGTASRDTPRQIETLDLAIGGPGGVANEHAQALLNRCLWLESQIPKFKTDSFVSGAGPFLLTHTPNGMVTFLFFDGVLQPLSNVVITDASMALAGGVSPSLFDNITVTYAY